jgi:ATP-dependent DNA helicase RecG
LDIKYLKGVGEKRANAFRNIGINKLEDFLSFIPRIYIPKIKINILNKYWDKNVIVYGEVIDVQHPKRSNQPVRIFVYDRTGTVEIPMFGGTEFRSKQFRLKEKYLFWGKVGEGYQSQWKLDYRDHLKLDEIIPNDLNLLKYNYIPIYELSGILKKTWIKPLLLTKIVFNAFLTLFSNSESILPETLTEDMLLCYNLVTKKDAVLRINFPLKEEDIEISRKRLAFEELFYLELLLALKKSVTKNEKKGISFNADITSVTENFNKVIQFKLTNAQKRVINEIYSDMKSGTVMNRLLQGDVGSGKTIVSIFCMLVALKNGYQSALMCPTEILAEQHYQSITNFVGKFNDISGENYKVEILIGGQKKKLREEILQNIKSGKTNLIIGTHALIQESVEFKRLGFVIIDEQHKFGVMQRGKLKDKGLNPDVLVMTATPIPRTLSLTFYGDLDVSVIDEMPEGRIKIKTFIREEKDKDKIVDFVKKEIRNGRQAFIIYPLIDESEKLDLKSAEESYKLLKENEFKEFNVGMIHGRMLWYEKDEIMKEFKDGKIKVLVSTTVVEVGIDIPNATIMIIEDAQRYGLSQLHQLRGRVGRGAEQSYCILIGKNLDDISRKRLEIMTQTTDGFRIAEEDLEIRGPGEFFGTRQSGILNFTCTDLNKDKDILDTSRKIAFSIIERDPQLRSPEHKLIRDVFSKYYKESMYLMNIA